MKKTFHCVAVKVIRGKLSQTDIYHLRALRFLFLRSWEEEKEEKEEENY
jgi:hypothetical protein